MITLFRRIRAKLIASGSVSKYLLYAVGEIRLANWSSILSSYAYIAPTIYDLYNSFIYPSIFRDYQMRNLTTSRTRVDFSDSPFPFDQSGILYNSELENHVVMRSYNAKTVYDLGLELELQTHLKS